MWARLKNVLLILAAVAIPLGVLSQKQSIFDWLHLRDYQPSQVVATLAADDSFTDYARHIFYVNHPGIISDPKTFQTDCTILEQTIILGCYHGNQLGIFIYSVSDPRLSGITQVTAAHEMLHAAYDRLSSADKKQVNALITNYYQHDLHDQRIINTINSYKKTEPNDTLNEMHSIFGSEIASLPSGLENYYQKYFQNRSAVAGFSDRYETEFTSRQAKMKVLEGQLNDLKVKIDSQQQTLSNQLNDLNAERSRLETLKSAGRDQDYNTAVDGFNAQVDIYNASVEAYRRDVKNYNSILSQYNDLAGELRTLYQAIDASVPTTSGQ